MRLGILSCEFHSYELGGVGGFGWATRTVGQLLATRPEAGLRPVYLSGRGVTVPDGKLDGIPFVVRGAGPVGYARALRAARPDLLLAIDYDSGFWPVLTGLPRTPLLLWSRDPRGRAEWDVIRRMRLPGDSLTEPAGLAYRGARSVRAFAELGRVARRPMSIVSPTPALARDRAPAAYGLRPREIPLLPNPVDDRPPAAAEASDPTVVFLGRLDPYKRPWLAVELARRMPAVRFLFAGRSHCEGERAWHPVDVPPNVGMLGHVDGEEKRALLGSAWLLLNTSAHEGLPVSFLEALAAQTPVVAAVDPERVVSRFGALARHMSGDGLAALDSYERAVSELLEDRRRREVLGRAGREWVTHTHTPELFLSALRRHAMALGV